MGIVGQALDIIGKRLYNFVVSYYYEVGEKGLSSRGVYCNG